MNNDLGNFIIEFTTKGLNEVKDGMKDLNTKMDDLSKNFTKGTDKGNNFFGKFRTWTNEALALAGGIASIGKAIKDTIDVSGKVIKLNVLADVAGVKAENVEALATAVAASVGGGKINYEGASALYRAIAETQTDAWRGQFSQQMVDEFARANITIRPDASKEEWLRALIRGMTYYRNDAGARLKFKDAFGGISDEMMLFLGQGEEKVWKWLNYGQQHSYLSGEDNLKAAEQLTKASMELKEAWGRMLTDLQEPVTTLLKELKTLFETFEPLIRGVVELLGNLLPLYTQLLEATKAFAEKWGVKLGEWWGKQTNDIRHGSAWLNVKKMYNSGDFSKIDWKTYYGAEQYLKNHPAFDTNETRAILQTAFNSLDMVKNNLNTQAGRNITFNITAGDTNVSVDDAGKGESVAKGFVDNIETAILNSTMIGGA